MTQPKFAPILEQHEVREVQRIAPPAAWEPHRPGEFRPGGQAAARLGGFGIPGPDQGYALRLAERYRDRIVLDPDEHGEDVMAGAVAIALRRAALYGRAPVTSDLELALGLFGYLAAEGGPAAPRDLVDFRRALFAGAGHDYWRQRSIADEVPESALRLTPDQVVERRDQHRDGWRTILAA